MPPLKSLGSLLSFGKLLLSLETFSVSQETICTQNLLIDLKMQIHSSSQTLVN